MRQHPSDYEQNVFINCPFDKDYRPLFEAIVFAVQIAGFRPRCALEASNAGEARIEKILNIISSCKYGIHDISRTELDKGTSLPRFNMPLELGLDLGCRRFGDAKHRSKRLLVMDRSPHRYQRFISDIAGQDITPHSKMPGQVIRHVRDWLSSESRAENIPGGPYVYRRYQTFQRELPDFCRKNKLDRKRLPFGDYSKAVRLWLEEKET